MNREPERNPRKALGKGLSALLPSRPASPQPEIAHIEQPAEQEEEFQNIPLDQIEPGERQPRDNFDTAKLEELAQSIRANGVIQPITVTKDSAGKYRIIAGERRWRAARIAGLSEIPALVRTVHNHQLLELALVENLQREDLNPIEIANAFFRLASELGLNHEAIAQRTGKDRSTVTNFLRLIRLSEPVKQALINGAISMGHARALVNLAGHDQTELCKQVIAKQISVRQTEALVSNLIREKADLPDNGKTSNAPAKSIDPNIRAALDEMAMTLGTKVRLVPKSAKAKAGRIEIEYYSQDDLDRIYSVIVRQ
jgi:ParB family chromosome partitioning protein